MYSAFIAASNLAGLAAAACSLGGSSPCCCASVFDSNGAASTMSHQILCVLDVISNVLLQFCNTSVF
jgi:hypothetical protein